MKKGIIYSIGLMLLFACEDVVDVDLPEVEPKLIVDGLLRVDKSQEFVNVEIRMKETTNYFDENLPTQVENAVITYGKPLNGDIFESLAFCSLAEKEPGSGIYIPDPNFSSDQRIRTSVVEPGMVFILELTHKGKTYYAQTEYVPTVPIDNLEQGDDTLFDEEETEVVVTFMDDPERDDFYVFDFGFGEFLTVEDQFFQGQEFQFSYFYDDSLNTGQDITVSILGATQDFYNYMDLVIEQTTNNGGVFQTPVATARGNVFDITGLDNIDIFDNVERPNDFALGYFAVVQAYSSTLTIE
ncbi:DUF4249 family protein [Flagellimonas taeanensis]|uniref:DUF4249 family protein n=1 Tax=Flavobacteriaceae TaxID=49546 RepID=UPI000E6A28BA|nr:MULTISPECIES: DUF4249 family protein [Allomuricauda]MDC6386866.1 DUF4249 family protein [Muricauda sp. SK9]RIV49273.1 DUF4249 family protein [Allomuricauda taeanensis]